MILLLGASGYVGQSFAEQLRERGIAFRPLARTEIDYTRFDTLKRHLEDVRPSFVINAAGFTGKPNVDACETARAETLQGNTLFPATLAHACTALGIPWGQVSSGCIYSGCQVLTPQGWTNEKDMTRPDIAHLIATAPGRVRGFDESVPPNFSFRDPPCSFYSGSKALAEEALEGIGRHYIWRLRIPFDEHDNGRNYLSKIQRYARVYDNINSLSHRADFTAACLDLWLRKAPFGTYNMTNPGHVSTREVVGMVKDILKPAREFEFWENDAEFYREGAATPRSNCILDSSKLARAGVTMRPVREALEHALRHWRATA